MSFSSRALLVALFAASVSVAVGCDRNGDKPKAQVGAPVDPVAAAKGANHELLGLDTASSKVGFVGAKVTGSHEGSFGGFTGSVDLTDGKIEGSQVTISIDMSTVSIPEQKLQDHLKSPDFFDVAKFPKATFQSTEIRKQDGAAGATHWVTGNLELHGVKKSIGFPAKITLDAGAVTANAEFVINRKDFGIVYAGMADNLIKDDVVIKFSVNATRKKS